MAEHLYKLVTKDDGLWLELNSPTSEKFACIHITANPVPGSIIHQVIEEVWTAIRTEAKKTNEGTTMKVTGKEQKRKREDRRIALHHAVQDRLETDSDAGDIVNNAEKYLKFLQGGDEEQQ